MAHARNGTGPDGSEGSSSDVPSAPDQRTVLLGVLTGEVTTEADLTLRNVSPSELEAEFRQRHLPELESAGYIEWDRETGEIAKGPNFEEIEPVLRAMADADDKSP